MSSETSHEGGPKPEYALPAGFELAYECWYMSAFRQAELGILLKIWAGAPTLREIVQAEMVTLELSEKYRLDRFIFDNVRLKTVWTDMVAWVSEVYMPMLERELKFKGAGIIQPTDRMTNYALDLLVTKELPFPVTLHTTFAEAYAWAKTL